MSRSATQERPAETSATKIEDPFEHVPDGRATAPTFHFIGCPAQRLEEFEAVKPKVVDEHGSFVAPARKVRVVRCIDCGAELVTESDGAETFVDPAEPGSVAPRAGSRRSAQ